MWRRDSARLQTFQKKYPQHGWHSRNELSPGICKAVLSSAHSPHLLRNGIAPFPKSPEGNSQLSTHLQIQGSKTGKATFTFYPAEDAKVVFILLVPGQPLTVITLKKLFSHSNFLVYGPAWHTALVQQSNPDVTGCRLLLPASCCVLSLALQTVQLRAVSS